MAERGNLTDQIPHPRNGEGSLPTLQASGPSIPPRKVGRRGPPERPFATDYFMLFVYALLAAALIAQIGLILWLDLI